MVIPVPKLFKELESGENYPFYLIEGEEQFQSGEISLRFKKHFFNEGSDDTFDFDSFDAEDLNIERLINSLNTLPGLFSKSGFRLVFLRRFEKMPQDKMEKLMEYLKNPSPTSCVVAFCSKLDKRKGWYKPLSSMARMVELAEPKGAEWQKWKNYFEKCLGKSIDESSWGVFLSYSNETLALVWSEIQKVATFVGDKPTIELNDFTVATSIREENIFVFVENVANKRRYEAMRGYELLKKDSNDIKLFAILLRQFRLVDQVLRLQKKKITDPKTIASLLGISPYFISKVIQQAKKWKLEEMERVFELMRECDYRLKMGHQSLFEDVLLNI